MSDDEIIKNVIYITKRNTGSTGPTGPTGMTGSSGNTAVNIRENLGDDLKLLRRIERINEDQRLLPLITYLFDALINCESEEKRSHIALFLASFMGFSKNPTENFYEKHNDEIDQAIKAIKDNTINIDDLLAYKGLPDNPFKIFQKYHEETYNRPLEVPKEVEKTFYLENVFELKRNSKVQSSLFVAGSLKNKTANFWRLELYARYKLCEQNRPFGKAVASIENRVVYLLHDELMDLQKTEHAHASSKSKNKDDMFDNIGLLNKACLDQNKFPMFSKIHKTNKGVLVEFSNLYASIYFDHKVLTMHLVVREIFTLTKIIDIKVLQVLIDHFSMLNNRKNNTHTCLGIKSIFEASFVDRGYPTPRARQLAINACLRGIRQALNDLDSKGLIQFYCWKQGRSKQRLDDEDVKFNYEQMLNEDYKVVYSIPAIDKHLKKRDKELGIETND